GVLSGRQHPEHGAPGLRRAARRGLHHAGAPAADEHGAGLGDAPADLLGVIEDIVLIPSTSNDRDLERPAQETLAAWASRSIIPISSSSPPLWRCSLRLPHFGLCTQEGQPLSQGHSPISLSASPTRRSNSS